MSDIIDIIDGLHAKATKGPVYRSEPSGIIDSSRGVFIAGGTWPHEGALLVELYNAWPAISARLREAERERDEWKLASSKNGDAMIGYQSRAIVAEQRLVEAERKAKAFDYIISHSEWHRYDVGTEERSDHITFRVAPGSDLSSKATRERAVLTAIEAAIAAKETKQ